MFKNINNQINEFTKNIKEIEGCDKLTSYMNSSYVSSIKLLMFASSTFSIYAKLLIFFIIANGGLLMFTFIGSLPFDFKPFLVVSIMLITLMLIYTFYFKNILSSSIEKVKNDMKE